MLVAAGAHVDGRDYGTGPANRGRVMTVTSRPLRLTAAAVACRFRTMLTDPTGPRQEESTRDTTGEAPRLWLGSAVFEAVHNGDVVLAS